MFADLLDSIGDLALGPLMQFLQKRIAHGGGIKAGRRKTVEINIAGLQRQQSFFPGVRDRAFLRQQRARAELKSDRAEIGIIEPVLPFRKPPHAARHDDRHFAQTPFAHHLAQGQHAGKRIFRFLRIFAVGKAVMAAGQPGIFINHAAQQVAEFMIGAQPKARNARAEETIG